MTPFSQAGMPRAGPGTRVAFSQCDHRGRFAPPYPYGHFAGLPQNLGGDLGRHHPNHFTQATRIQRPNQLQQEPFRPEGLAIKQGVGRLDHSHIGAAKGDGVLEDLLWRKVGAHAFTSGLNYSQHRRKQKPQVMCLRLVLCEARKRGGSSDGCARLCSLLLKLLYNCES